MDFPTIELEVQRVQNLVKGFGWKKTQETVADGKIILILEKTTPLAAQGTTELPT